MKSLVPLTFISFLFSACAKDSSVPLHQRPSGCDSIAFSYSIHIAPVLQGNCSLPACHITGGEGSYDFTNYAVVASRIRTGRFIDRLLLPVDDPMHMPPGIHMNPCEKYSLISWIQQGYPEN